MRRTATILAALLTLGAVLGITACEPKATVTANVSEAHPACWNPVQITGKVNPADATKKVVLQRSYGGKWKDVVSPLDYGQTATLRSSAVNQSTGSYLIAFALTAPGSYHLRVRSNSGENVSPGFYMSPLLR